MFLKNKEIHDDDYLDIVNTYNLQDKLNIYLDKLSKICFNKFMTKTENDDMLRGELIAYRKMQNCLTEMFSKGDNK